jgi:hypothetical protein
MEGSLVAYKVFTNGSVLNASEINDNLMNQSVMVFSNSTARSAALTAPVEGMLTWLQDTNLYEYYSGAGAWTALVPASTPSGLTKVNTTSFSAVSSQSVNDVFSTTYDAYKLVWNLTSTNATTLRIQMRVGGADATGADYSRQILAVEGTGSAVSATRVASQTGYDMVDVTNKGTGEVSIYNPFKTEATTFTAFGGKDLASNGNQNWMTTNGNHQLATSYTGFTISVAAGTITGDVTIYGLAK